MPPPKLDLINLGNLAALALDDAPASQGTPLELPIDAVIEDPAQPRIYFSDDAIAHLAAQIRASPSQKIRSPISVQPKNADGKYVINHGARRYRATVLLGMATIPAFIDASHDDYDQLAENIQREDLTPLEIALFIKKRMDLGEKKGAIAAKLGQHPSFVSEHVSLVDAPEFIQALARDKRVGVRTLYDLTKAHATCPEATTAYVATSAEVTRAGVAALVGTLPRVEETHQGNADRLLMTSNNAAIAVNEAAVQDAPANHAPSVTAKKLAAKTLTQVSSQRAILVKDGNRLAALLQRGRVEIRYKDTGEVADIELTALEVIGTEIVSDEDNVEHHD